MNASESEMQTAAAVIAERLGDVEISRAREIADRITSLGISTVAWQARTMSDSDLRLLAQLAEQTDEPRRSTQPGVLKDWHAGPPHTDWHAGPAHW